MSKSLIINKESKYIIDGKDKIVAVLLESNTANIEYQLSDGDFKVLVFSNYDGDTIINETGFIKNGTLNIDYIDLNNHKFIQNCHIEVYKNANINVNSIYLGINDKKVSFDLINKEGDSNINISNNVVVLDKASFKMDVVGTILKGAKRSTCFQKSHCLTVDNPKLAQVLPVLNIDENDVEASHSLSIGTIDDETLFYMNARGMSKKEALNLMISSYLLPLDSFYDEFSNGKELKEYAINKVNEICLI